MADIEKFEVEKDPEAGMESPKTEGEVKPVPPEWKEVYGGSKFAVSSLFPPFTWLPAYVRYAKGGVPRLHVTNVWTSVFAELMSQTDDNTLSGVSDVSGSRSWRHCYQWRHREDGRTAVLHEGRLDCRPRDGDVAEGIDLS